MIEARNILLWGSWGCSEAMAVCHWWSRLLSAQLGLWLVTRPWSRPLIGWWARHWPPPGHEAGLRLALATLHLRCHSRQWPSLTRGDNTRDHTCLAVTRRHVTRDDSQQVIASDWWHVASARAPEVLWSLDVTSADTETRVSASSQAQSLCSI